MHACAYICMHVCMMHVFTKKTERSKSKTTFATKKKRCWYKNTRMHRNVCRVACVCGFQGKTKLNTAHYTLCMYPLLTFCFLAERITQTLTSTMWTWTSWLSDSFAPSRYVAKQESAERPRQSQYLPDRALISESAALSRWPPRHVVPFLLYIYTFGFGCHTSSLEERHSSVQLLP